MALFIPGVAITQASGRVGGTVFSHNRGGMYMRAGVIPKKVTSAAALNQKSILSSVTRDWAGESDAARLTWQHYTVENPVVNRIGQKKTLSGHQAYVGLNSRLLRAGDSTISTPPVIAPPAAITISSFSVNVGLTTAEIAFAASPLGANIRLWTWAAYVTSPGQSFIGSRFVLVEVSAKNAATPADIYNSLTDRFGTLTAGGVVWIRCQTMDSTTGLVSGFATTSAVVA
jgi:hypothetical protein